jgi:CrcB protein|tara:strand:- start:2545 stop:2919 length:375 start_codon:yes stop_codon:yes gene_type:complete
MVRMPLIATVALGATVGTTIRWAVLEASGAAAFPWPVLLVNIVGCTLLGLLIGLRVPRSTALLLGTGLCGGLTTFSTFTVEAAQMMRADDTALAITYVVCSVAGGLAAVVAGRTAGAMVGGPAC